MNDTNAATSWCSAGIAICGVDAAGGGLVQHYFDSRGVARVHAMTLDDGGWTLWRSDADLSHRFEATISDDGSTIIGAWQIGPPHAAPDAERSHDVDLTYTRVG